MAIHPWVWLKVPWNFTHSPLRKLSQYCTEHESQQSAGDGSGLSFTHTADGCWVWWILSPASGCNRSRRRRRWPCKSAAGIGTLLEDGIGDTVRVSLTEDPEFEIPVCRDLVKRYTAKDRTTKHIPVIDKMTYNPFNYQRRESFEVGNIGGKQVPIVVADLSKAGKITPATLERVELYLRCWYR